MPTYSHVGRKGISVIVKKFEHVPAGDSVQSNLNMSGEGTGLGPLPCEQTDLQNDLLTDETENITIPQYKLPLHIL